MNKRTRDKECRRREVSLFGQALPRLQNLPLPW